MTSAHASQNLLYRIDPAAGTRPEHPAAPRPPGCASLDWRESLWVQTLSAEHRAQVAEHICVRPVAGGTMLLRRGEVPTHWIGVLDGLVKLHSSSAQGKIATFAGIPAGGWFGEGSLIKEGPRLYAAEALRDSVIALLPRTTFRWLLDHSLPFNHFLLQQLNERLGVFISVVETDRLLDPDGKVARCLANLYNRHLFPQTPAQLHLSQEEIGHLSGLSRQRTNQALRELSRRGLISIDYGAITVLDVAALDTFARS